MNYPDEYLPGVTLSLTDVLTDCRALIERGAGDAFAGLLLAGRRWQHNVEHRVVLDATRDMPTGDATTCTITGDFDSLIGITDALPLAKPLSVFPVPSFRDTLTKTVHLTMAVEIRGVRASMVVLLSLTRWTGHPQGPTAALWERVSGQVRAAIASSHAVPRYHR